MSKISKLTPEPIVLKEFATRLARIRKTKGYTQSELAKEAGIGVATLRRIESGQDCQFGSWIKIFMALDMIHVIDELLPNSFNSPKAEVLAGKPRNRRKLSTPPGVIWRDEIK